jgi:hypothetical protein
VIVRIAITAVITIGRRITDFHWDSHCTVDTDITTIIIATIATVGGITGEVSAWGTVVATMGDTAAFLSLTVIDPIARACSSSGLLLPHGRVTLGHGTPNRNCHLYASHAWRRRWMWPGVGGLGNLDSE